MVVLAGAGYSGWRLRPPHSAIPQVRALHLEPELHFSKDFVVEQPDPLWVATLYTTELAPGEARRLVQERLASAGYTLVDDPQTLTAFAWDNGSAPDGFPVHLGDGTTMSGRRPGD